MNESCLFPDCPKAFYARGLCASHYRKARKLVEAGRTTWEKLEATGKCAPANGSGQNSGDYKWFLAGKPKGRMVWK